MTNFLHPRELTRCRRCVLPATVPFIELDAEGTCRHCRASSFTQERVDTSIAEQLAARLHSNADGNNCIVALSGGRDSCFVLHYVVKRLGLKPVVFSYDWGMLTPTGERNQKLICGELGLEITTISDNILRKRKNIRRNLLAWLKRPALGMIPLFMAGDKHFFHYAQKFKNDSGLTTIFCGMSDIEAEDFKEGFCGIRTDSFENKSAHYKMSPAQVLKILFFYGSNFLLNPAYINASIPETVLGFYYYYLLGHDYITNLYTFVEWNEETIISTLESQYGWEREPDTVSSWRAGDASAPLISALFLLNAGFTENDFLRSNQIRRGMLTREKALQLVLAENKIRIEGLKLFCRLIELEFDLLDARLGLCKAQKILDNG